MIDTKDITSKYGVTIDANKAQIDKLTKEISDLKVNYDSISAQIALLPTSTPNQNQGNQYGNIATGFDLKNQQLQISIDINSKQDSINLLGAENARLEADRNLEIIQANILNEKEFNEQNIYPQRLKVAVKDAESGGTAFTKEDKRYLFLVFLKIVILGVLIFVAVKVFK